jgi:glycosyltransferase involved in cell wall biosynthesis
MTSSLDQDQNLSHAARETQYTGPGSQTGERDARTQRPLRVLIATKIFPNQAAPGWAPFNRQQFAALSRLPGVQVVDVLATIPYFPGVGLLGSRSLAAGLTAVPERECIDGLSVRHPRTLYLPRIDHGLSGVLHAASLLPHFLAYRGKVDVLLAAWAYPDGCAAVLLGRLLSVPVVVKLHGSDINLLAQRAGPRQAMRALLPRAARIVSVSQALSDRVQALGVRRERIDVVRNGVDSTLFYPREQQAARRELGLSAAPTVVCISRLEPAKGVLDLLEAFALLRTSRPEARLCLVGGGAAAAACAERAAREDLRGAVDLPGAVPLSEVPRYLAAADVVVMPSWAEGLPNTVLEAHACGRKVVSTDVGGVGEVITAPELGALAPPQQPRALAVALLSALATPSDAARIAAAHLAAVGGWESSAGKLLASLRRAMREEPHVQS